MQTALLTRYYGLALGRKQINIVYSLHTKYMCTRDLVHNSVSMAGHSVENVPGSAVYFGTAVVLMKGQNYNFFYCFVRVLNLVLHVNGRI